MTDSRSLGPHDSSDNRGADPTRSSGPTDSEADTIAVSGVSGASPGRGDSLSPGQRIGPYRIERLLGSGGMGEVYAAEHVESGHRLAVKVLPSSESWSPELRARFSREGTLAATINHPNSLYVYGTAEVEGVPLIAMELAPGGTLEDRVRAKGPLPVTGAVDAALQMIAGLQAALDAGVLHRDVKPANCFVDRNGIVKIGDYGLSFPTATATDTRLTTTGAIMATPAFAPPEQLRGEDVDVRADLYAVGATLYYLLTGKLPLEASGAMQLVAAVLQRIPDSPRKHRPEISDDLAAAVMRCLKKEPAERFQNYTELRQALEPFSSAVPLAAPQGIRFGAGAFDWVLLGLLTIAVTLWTTTDVINGQDDLRNLITSIAMGFVYSIPEALWGRSLGKKLTGLRIVNVSGGRVDYGHMLLRTAAYLSPAALLGLAVVLMPERSMGRESLDLLSVLSPLLLFLPWNKAGRQVGWHDRTSRTIVVRARPASAEYRMHAPSRSAAALQYPYSVGPYRVASDPAGSQPGQVLRARDLRLQRNVWIVVQPGDALPIAAARRELSRETRLRWLHGRRSLEFSWDAFEAPEGHALFSADASAEPWVVVRRWLLELARETQQVLEEGSDIEVLAPERVWVTDGGKVVLLDFVPAGVERLIRGRAGEASALHDEWAITQTFLSRVARRALLGAADPEPGSTHAPELPLPLHISRVLTGLSAGRYESCTALIEGLRASSQRPERITGRRRLLQFTVPTLLFVGLLLPPFFLERLVREAGEREHPGYRQAIYCLAEVRALERKRGPDSELRRRDLLIYLAGPLGSVVRYSAGAVMLKGSSFPLFSPVERFRIHHALQLLPSPTPEAIRQARARLQPELTEARIRRRELEDAAKVGLIGLVLPALLAPLLVIVGVALRGGALLRLFGIVVVTARGREASRGRILARSIISWAPFLVVWLLALSLMLAPEPDRFPGVGGPSPGLARGLGQRAGHAAYYLSRAVRLMVGIPMVLFVAGALYAIARPQRAIQDQLVGTYLVPR